MRPPYRWGADPHELRRLARTVVRKAVHFSLTDVDDFERGVGFKPTDAWAERTGPWNVGLLCISTEPEFWLLAVVAMDDRARWEHLPPFLTVMRVPPGTPPLVRAEDTPPGQPLYWFWRPGRGDATSRHAPAKAGLPAPDEHAAGMRYLIEREHAAIRAAAARRADAERAAEALADRDVAEAQAEFEAGRASFSVVFNPLADADGWTAQSLVASSRLPAGAVIEQPAESDFEDDFGDEDDLRVLDEDAGAHQRGRSSDWWAHPVATESPAADPLEDGADAGPPPAPKPARRVVVPRIGGNMSLLVLSSFIAAVDPDRERG